MKPMSEYRLFNFTWMVISCVAKEMPTRRQPGGGANSGGLEKCHTSVVALGGLAGLIYVIWVRYVSS